ncbi:MAG: hypothetical protein ABEJ87_00425 [Candidatus Nanohalobium sp.]
MDLRELLKEWRIWVLLVVIVISTLMLNPHYENQVSIGVNRTMNDKIVNKTLAGIKYDNLDIRNNRNGSTVSLRTSARSSEIKQAFTSRGYTVKHISSDTVLATRLDNRKSIEFSGGMRILLGLKTNKTGDALKQQVQQIERILQIRLSRAGLADTSVRSINLGNGQYKIQVQTGSTDTANLKKLISQQGSFEARMPIIVQDEKNFTIENTYTFRRKNESSISVSRGSKDLGTYNLGDDFEINDNHYYYVNNTNQSARLEVVAYSGSEIIKVLSSQGRLTGGPTSGYRWSFQIVIEKSAAQRVQKISNNYQTVITQGGPQLGLDNGQPARLTYYVDGSETTSLTVAAVFKNQVITKPSVQGGASSRQGAVNERDRLQAILQSGKLPVPVQIESNNKISSSLGDQFLAASSLSILAALVAVGGIVFLRYRDPKVVIPIIITGAAETYILLGLWFTTAGTLSLSAIAGIIAAVGTGVDDQIIITDESGRERVASWSDRMKRAFFVIFTSAASTIGAMLPVIQPGLISLFVGAAGAGLIGYTMYSRKTNLHYFGIGLIALMVGVFTTELHPSGSALQAIHEFAYTTILGILVGIMITRPAYAKTIEHIRND